MHHLPPKPLPPPRISTRTALELGLGSLPDRKKTAQDVSPARRLPLALGRGVSLIPSLLSFSPCHQIEDLVRSFSFGPAAHQPTRTHDSAATCTPSPPRETIPPIGSEREAILRERARQWKDAQECAAYESPLSKKSKGWHTDLPVGRERPAHPPFPRLEENWWNVVAEAAGQPGSQQVYRDALLLRMALEKFGPREFATQRRGAKLAAEMLPPESNPFLLIPYDELEALYAENSNTTTRAQGPQPLAALPCL
ncbi:hypothetical protein P7C73_g6870, partial [Tremellales sp. Uapishka_1]